MVVIGKKAEDCTFKIRSVQANRVYQVNNGYKYDKNGKKEIQEKDIQDCRLTWRNAVINDSIFSRYMLKHGVRVSKKESVDLISMKFEYSVPQYSEKELCCDENEKPDDVQNGVSTKNLREDYYTKGVNITWHKYDKTTGMPIPEADENICYKMLMRSPGKAKKGECIFIKDKLLDTARNYLTMGLYEKMPDKNAKIVELSAYSTLITATALDYIHIPLKNMLIVKDLKAAVNIPALLVKINNDKQCLVEAQDDYKVTNTLWDGMGLIDDSIFPEDMEGFIYCRSHFFKSCLFRGNIQQYFKDYYKTEYETATVTDMFGNVMKVSDVKVIVTDNSIKWLKFKELMGNTDAEAYKYYKRFMKKDGEQFTIVKTAHKSKYGDLQRSSYQMNNSLPTVDRTVLESIAKTSIDYYNSMIIDDDAFIEYLKIGASKKYSINNMLIDLDKINSHFRYTPFFKKKKSDMLSQFKNKRLKLGKLLQYGDNLTICGNPVALLKYITGELKTNDGYVEDDCFSCFTQRDEGIECYTTRFNDGECLAGFRSPHNSPNNIVHLINKHPDILQKYFPKLGDNVIVINGIYTDVQDRLNGQDLDTDSVFVTNQKDIVDLARKSHSEYATIINEIPRLGASKYGKDMKSYYDMDYKIALSQNDVGYASNLAQLALSYYYDDGFKDNIKDNRLLNIFVICSVLAQVAIDSAKRIFDVEVTSELRRLSIICKEIIKSKWTDDKQGVYYPRFYAEIMEMKDSKKNIPDKQIGEFICPMDIIYKLIDEKVIDTRKQKKYQTVTDGISYVFRYDKNEFVGFKRDSKQYYKITSIVEEYYRRVKRISTNEKDYSEQVSFEFEGCMAKLKKLKINKATMGSLIQYAFSQHCNIRTKLLVSLYEYNKNIFLECFINDQNIQKTPPKIA